MRPFCTPKLTVVSYPSTASTAKPVAISRADTHPVAHPTFDAPPSADGGVGATGNGNGVGSPVSYPGPRLVMLGCDGCGIPELWRTLVAARPPGGRLQVALTNPGDPSWRDRQVHYFDHESRFALGTGWYMQLSLIHI